MGKEQPASPAPEPASAPEPAVPAPEPAAPTAPAVQQVPEAARSPEASSDEAAFQEADLQSKELDDAAQMRAQQLLEKSKAIFGARIGAEESRNLAEEIGMKAKLAEDSDYDPETIVDKENNLNKLEQELTGEKLRFRVDDIHSKNETLNGVDKSIKTTPAYVMTHDERGTVLGRLRVRNPETGRVEGRVDPGMRVTIVTSAPVLKFKSKEEGEILFVKIRYTDADGKEREGYAALKYLVSPYEHAQANEAAAPAPAAEPAPKPAAEQEQSSAPASDELPVPAARPDDAPEDKKNKKTQESAEAPAPSLEQKEQIREIQNGDRIVVISQGRRAFFEAYAGNNVILRFQTGGEVNRRRGDQLYVFPLRDIVPLARGVEMKSTEPEAKVGESDEVLQGWYELRHVSMSRQVTRKGGVPNTVLAGPGVIVTKKQIEERGDYHFTRVSIGSELSGSIRLVTSEDPKTRRSIRSFRSLPGGPPEHADEIPVYARMSASFAEQLRQGETPQLKFKKDRFYRIKEGRGVLREDQLVYVLEGIDFQKIDKNSAQLISVMTSDGIEFFIPRRSLENKPLEYTGSVDDSTTPDIWGFMAQRWLRFREQLHMANRDVQYLPDLNPDNIKGMTENFNYNGLSIPKKRLVRMINLDPAGKIAQIETWEGKLAWVPREILKDVNRDSKNLYIYRRMNNAQKQHFSQK